MDEWQSPSSEKKLSINVVVARYGGGHYVTYEALRSIIEERKLPWELKTTDVGDIVNRLSEEPKFVNFYKLIGTNNDDFYNQILQNGWTWIHPLLLIFNQILFKLNYKLGLKFFTQYWREQQPDLVVSTIPLYNKGLWESLQKGKPGTPLVVIPLDYADTPPGFYIEPKTANYTVCPSEKFIKQARSLGVKEERIIRTSGVVVHPRFYQPVKFNCASERQRLGLDPDCLTGLVMFGGNGSKVMLEIAKRLETFQGKLQLIFLCGHNEELACALRDYSGFQKRFVTTFTEDIPYYMHLADFFIGKAGGNSISEATVMNLPTIVERNATTLINERHNIDWLQQQGAGLVIRSFRHINRAVEQFLEPEILARYRANVARLNNRAVFEVCELLQQILAKTDQAGEQRIGGRGGKITVQDPTFMYGFPPCFPLPPPLPLL